MRASDHLSTQENVRFWHTVETRDKALFYEHLSNMVDGGVPVIQALRSFLDKNKNPLLLSEISNLLFFVESGDSFSIAMKKLPNIFDRREIAIVAAGEQSGTMQRSFANLANELRSQEDLVRKVKGALTYPFIIVIFLLLAMVTIMTYVIPKIEPLFATTGVELPSITQALISTSRFFEHNIILIMILVIAGIFAFKAYERTEAGRRSLDTIFLRIPLVGDVYRNYIIVRVAASLALLMESGIPIIRTLELTAEGSNNAVFADHIRDIAKRVENGKKLAESIEASDPEYRVFTQDFSQIVSAGERTSTVNKVCRKLADQYSREVDSSVTILVRFIEPAAILIAGLFVLWFAFGIFSAVMKITETVG